MNRHFVVPGHRIRFLAVFLLAGIPSGTLACNIPVFRYALERWKPDSLEVFVFHQQPLDSDSIRLLGQLQQTGPGNVTSTGEPRLPLTIKPVKLLQKEDSEAARIWKQLAADRPPSLPRLVVRLKLARGRTVNAWHAPFDSEHIRMLTESPVRTELRKRLLKGDSIIWLMVRSRDQERNRQVRQSLEKQLALLQSQLELPEGIGLPGSELFSDVPLFLRFTVLEMDSRDPREGFLVSLFRGLQPEAFAAGDPLLVPVFGRGRALEVIPAVDLEPGLVADLTAFLCGACSCQVKEQNPGFDLPMNAAWETDLFGPDGLVPPPREPTGSGKRKPRTIPLPPGRPQSKSKR